MEWSSRLLFLGWTLNYEMFFYAVYAACLAFGLRSPLAPVACIVFLVITGQFVESDNVAWRFYTNPLVLEFVFGIALYLLHARYPHFFAGRMRALVVAFTAAVIIRQTTSALPWLVTNGIPATLLTAAMLPWLPARTPAMLFVILLGDASYSLYLSHPYIIQLLFKLLPDQSGLIVQGLAGIGACALSIAVAVLLYLTIERPTQMFFNGRTGRSEFRAEEAVRLHAFVNHPACRPGCTSSSGAIW